MKKLAFIFPGQGVQKAGMGKDFYDTWESAKSIFDQAEEWLSLDMKALCFEPNDRLDLTEYTQAALVTTCLAMEKVLEDDYGIVPDVAAGLSLGEYCAIETAGAMTPKDAIQVIRQRGILMSNAVPAGKGGMMAVLGLEVPVVEQAVAPIEGVTVANYNCPGQQVITGESQALLKAADILKEAGARRVLPLNVSGPFHSPMLREAADRLYDVLQPVNLGELKLPYVTNVTGDYVRDTDQIKNLLAKQICGSVRWQQSMELLTADGVDTFVEIGPGKTLAGFLRKIAPEAKVYNVQTAADVEPTAEAIKAERA